MSAAHTARLSRIIAEAAQEAKETLLSTEADVATFCMGYIAAAYEEKCNVINDLMKALQEAREELMRYNDGDEECIELIDAALAKATGAA